MRTMRLLALALVLVSGTCVLAAPPCTGALKKSCAKKLFGCFKPAGSCTGELTISPTGVSTVQCWENGARIVLDVGLAGGTVEYRNKRGKRCLRGAVVAEGGDDTGAFVFKRQRKTWTIRGTEDDGIAITCPNGSVETYTEADLAQESPSCGGFGAACRLGDCP